MKRKIKEILRNKIILLTSLFKAKKFVILALFFVLPAVFVGVEVRAATVTSDDNVNISAYVPGVEDATGGGGSGNTNLATVVLSGVTFPDAKMTVLIDGQVVSVLIADDTGKFALTINSLNYGNYQISIFAEDPLGVLSAPHVVNVSAFQTQPYFFENIILPPTMQVSQTAVAAGQSLTVFGYAPPGATVTATTFESALFSGETVADNSGFYRMVIVLPEDFTGGTYSLRTKATLGDFSSFYSRPVFVTVGGAGLGIPGLPILPPAQLASCVDYNNDQRINLIDFSILLFWFEKENPPRSIDCDGNNQINIKDFSLLMYYWTG